MRTIAITTLGLSLFSLGEAIRFAELLRFTSVSATGLDAILSLSLTSNAPAMTRASESLNMQKLDLRQAVPVPAAPNAGVNAAIPPALPTSTVAVPAIPPAIAPGAAPVGLVAVPPVITSAPPAPQTDPEISITVQWVETWIDSTSRTWLPHTITLRNQALSDAAPPPGKGEIGMGTLTGRLGVTKTVIKGAARTVGPEWKMGAMAAVGIGIAGIV